MPPNFRSRAICPCDDIVNSLDHILSSCSSPGQRIVWKLVNSVWKAWSGKALPKQNVSSILGSPLVNIDGRSKIESVGLFCLYRILVVESAYLIWVLRYKREIRKENLPFSEEEVMRRWKKMMVSRVDLDKKLTSLKVGKHAITMNLVEAT